MTVVDVRTADLNEAVRAVFAATGGWLGAGEVIKAMSDGGFRFGTELWPFGAPGADYSPARVAGAVLGELRDLVGAGELREDSRDGLPVFKRVARRPERTPWWSPRRAGVVAVAACVALLAFTAGLGAATSASSAPAVDAPGTWIVDGVALAMPAPFTSSVSTMYDDTSGGTETEPETESACVGEDSPCWNPCTMGVADPATGRPGPCDLTSPLPYGETFQVSVVPGADPGVGVTCDPVTGTYFVRVSVWVVDAQSAVMDGHAAMANGCVPRDGGPFAKSVTWVPDLFLTAASGL